MLIFPLVKMVGSITLMYTPDKVFYAMRHPRLFQPWPLSPRFYIRLNVYRFIVTNKIP